MAEYKYSDISEILFGQIVSINCQIYKKGFSCWKYELETINNGHVSMFNDDDNYKLELLYHPDHTLNVGIMNDRYVHLSSGGKTQLKFDDIEHVDYIAGKWFYMPGIIFYMKNGTQIIKHYYYDKVCRILYDKIAKKINSD